MLGAKAGARIQSGFEATARGGGWMFGSFSLADSFKGIPGSELVA